LLCVLVLPLPRSGSSMVAGILHHLGVDMGPCQPPDVGNPLGYFEDVRFRWLHRSWSRRYAANPARARLRLPPWDPAPDALDLARYTRLIRACEQRPCWGVKDPELCYYAPLFAATLRQPPRLIATTRDPGMAAASLRIMRPHFSPADCVNITREYARRQALTLEALEARGVAGALVVDYDEAVDDPAAAVRRIAESIGRPATAAAAAFVTPRLRRHRRHRPADTLRNDDQGVTTLTT